MNWTEPSDVPMWLALIVIVFAVASLRQLAIADRVTQLPRYKLWAMFDRAGGFIPYHARFLWGCASCLPWWIGLGLWLAYIGEVPYIFDVAVVFAIRQVAQYILMFTGDADDRDLPPGSYFPPLTPEAHRREKAKREAEEQPAPLP